MPSRAATPDLPVILAGHTHHQNAGRLLAAADGAFVGGCLEREGWGSEIDAARVEAYMDVVRRIPQ
jgi:predicted TIM-barrel enzyme